MFRQSAHLLALRRHPLFRGLPESATGALAQASCSRRLAAGTPLYHQGDPAGHFFILVSGQLKLHRHGADGQEHVLGIVRPGGVVGETLLYHEHPQHLLSASALRDSLVIRVHNASYRALLASHPQLYPALLARLSQRLNQRLEDIDNLASSNAHHRVARYLMRRQLGAGGVVELDVPKRLIASKLGIQPETLSRILHRLSEAGLIRVEKQQIEILDTAALAAFVHDAANQGCTSPRRSAASRAGSAESPSASKGRGPSPRRNGCGGVSSSRRVGGGIGTGSGSSGSRSSQ